MLEWNTDTRLIVDGTGFMLAPTDLRSARPDTRAGALLLRKPRWMVERYAALTSQLAPANIVELGIYEGGSTALLALLFRPRRLVAVDLEPDRVAALDDFVDRRDLGAAVHAHYGVDQADRPRLEKIVDDEFGAEPLDLVIDDASHLLDETTGSFNLLFPRLRPGGLFVIEDWSWQHMRDEVTAEKLQSDPRALAALARRLESSTPPASADPLSRLVIELVLTAGYGGNVVAGVTDLRRGWAVVQRGDAPLDRNDFDISRAYGALGRTLLAERASRRGAS